MAQRELFLEKLRSAIGKPYRWGAMGPDNFDCSGLVVYCLNSAGWKLPKTCAADLFDMFHNYKVLPSIAEPGTLFFYGTSHVMILLERWDDERYILCGARGGNSTTTNNVTAYNQGAFVDVVQGGYWSKNFSGCLDPFRK